MCVGGSRERTGGIDADTAGDRKRGRVKEPHGDKKGREERGEETGVTKEAEAGEKRA